MSAYRKIATAALGALLATGAFAGTATPALALHDGESDRRHLEADLRGRNEVPPADRNGRGEAEIVLRPTQGVVCFDIEVKRIAEITGIHIHEGEEGENGPIVIDLNYAVNGVDGCVSADPALLSDIRSNPEDYYLNVHTTEFPSGAIRGQLERN